MLEITNVHTVNGHQYRDLHRGFEDGTEEYIGSEVLTTHCGWTEIHICTRACDIDCKNAQELFDEIGIEY